MTRRRIKCISFLYYWSVCSFTYLSLARKRTKKARGKRNRLVDDEKVWLGSSLRRSMGPRPSAGDMIVSEKKLRVKVRSSGYQTRLTFERSWVRISSQLIRNGNGVKAMSGSILVPNPGSLNKEKKKNTGSLMGHTNKHHLKKISTDQKSISNIPKIKTQMLNDSAI